MLVRYLMFFLIVYQSALLRSKDLQIEISSKFFTARDLLKTVLVDNTWIGLETVFTRIPPNVGLFEHKERIEMIFETNENSWNPIELARKIECDALERILIEKDIKSRNWNKLYQGDDYMLPRRHWHQRHSGLGDFLKFLAAILDVNAVDEYQHTSIHFAAVYDNIGVMEILLKRNEANPNVRNKLRMTPLHFATEHNGIGTIELLLNNGAEIDAADVNLITPLMKAVGRGHCNAAKILLSHQANPNLQNILGETALDIAVAYGGTDVVKLLLKHRDEGNIVLANKLKTQMKIATIYRDWNSTKNILSLLFVKTFLKPKQYQILIVSFFLVLFFFLLYF